MSAPHDPSEPVRPAGIGTRLARRTADLWSRRRRPILAGAGAVVVLLIGAYVVAALSTDGDLPNRATVAGIDVGGRSPADAGTVAAAAMAERLAQPIRVQAGGATLDTTLADLGVRFDPASTVHSDEGTFDPARVWNSVVGGDDITPVLTLDAAVAAKASAALAEMATVAPVDGGVSFDAGTVVTKDPVVGRRLDPATARAAVLAAAQTGGGTVTSPLALATTDTQPAISQTVIDRAVSGFAAPAMSAPVRVKVGPRSFDATPAMLSPALSLTPDGSALKPTIDPAALRKALGDRVSRAETKPTAARFEIEKGRPVIVGGTDGVLASTTELADAVMAALTKSGDERTAVVDVQRTPSKNGPASLEALGVKEKVGTFTTRYPYAEYRNTNIGRAAELVDGALLRPGQVFSLNKRVGERTKANGFTTGFVINGGRLREELGGGVSQMATTLYNASFFAGMTDVEHRAHAFYIDRYPVGREATVYWGSLDLKFGNNTPYGVYIQADIDRAAPGGEGVLTVTLWSTKYWQVTTTTSDRYGYRAPATIVDSRSGCVDQIGSSGFDVDITRRIALAGKHVKTEKYTVAYSPEDSITCTG